MNLLSPRDHAVRLAFGTVIVSEAVLFAALVSFHGIPHRVPSHGGFMIAASVALLLFGGAGALASAVRCTREGRDSAAAHRLILVGVAGVAALALELGAGRLGGARDPLSLVIGGLHAAHVAAGIALSTWVLALLQTRRVHRHHHDVLTLVMTYWYFVAGVWMFVWPFIASGRA